MTNTEKNLRKIIYIQMEQISNLKKENEFQTDTIKCLADIIQIMEARTNLLKHALKEYEKTKEMLTN